MILSASSLIRLEEVRAEGPTAWYQAYLPGEPPRIEALVDRVAAAGYDTFVLTADVPVSANRENNVRNGYSLPLRPNLRLAWEGISHPRWLLGHRAADPEEPRHAAFREHGRDPRPAGALGQPDPQDRPAGRALLGASGADPGPLARATCW